jgi:hypothetical protein
MDPEQNFYPKLGLTLAADNKMVSPPLEDISPLLSRKKFFSEMIIKPHEKSNNIIATFRKKIKKIKKKNILYKKVDLKKKFFSIIILKH